MLHAKIVFGAAGPNSGPAVLPNAPCENHASDHKHEFPICGSTERSTQNPCFGFQTRTLDLHFYRMLHAKAVFRTANTNSRFPVLPNAPRENRVLGYKHELSTCRFTERSTRKPCFGLQTRTLDLHFYRTLHAKTVVLDLELDFSTLLGSRFFDTLYAKTQFRPRFTVWVFKILNSVNSTVGWGRGRARPGHFCGLGCHAGEHCTGAPAPNGKETLALRGRGHGGGG